jgi:hypothetical protein
VIEKGSVGHGLCVVKLVDDDDLVRISREVRDSLGIQRLDGREHVLPPFRPATADVQLTKAGVSQHLPVSTHGLAQDLLTVRHEEQ